MRLFLCCCFAILVLGSCKKDIKNGPKVEIYLLTSFKINRDPLFTSLTPYTPFITDAVLASTPIVNDRDIRYYRQSDHIFKLKRSIKEDIRNYGASTGFAVTVDKDPVYYGMFHPAYLSSITFGLATIDPIIFVNEDELRLSYVGMTGDPQMAQLDKRNDSRLLSALRATDRLR
jgi:hypothetical protein